MEMMQGVGMWFVVASGGAVGAVLRYGAGRAMMRLLGSSFPWATLIVNIFGSFCMGLLVAWLLAREGQDQPGAQAIRAFMVVGLLGAFTTFSTFSLDVVTLLERKAYAAAGGYLTASVLLSIVGLMVGLMIGRILS